jgi:hypothetical protein
MTILWEAAGTLREAARTLRVACTILLAVGVVVHPLSNSGVDPAWIRA